MDFFRLKPAAVDLAYKPGVFGWSPILGQRDMLLVTFYGLLIFLARAVLTKLVFLPLAHRFAIYKRSFTLKIVENMWYCVYYPAMVAFGWYILNGEAFFPWNAKGYWTDFPNYSDWDTRPLAFFYYMFQLGFYWQGFVALLWFETKRKDFVELCIHHAVTIVLIVFSYSASQHRIGLNVLLIHDISDILLYGTKVLHYLDKFGNWAKTFLVVATNISFLVFAMAFAYTRNYIYPRFVVLPSLLAGFWNVTTNCPVQGCEHLAVKTISGVAGTGTGFLGNLLSAIHYIYDPQRTAWFEISHLGACVGGHCFHSGCVLIVFMAVLELLHIFWMLMILKMIYRSLFQLKQVKQDIRSDSEDEEEWAENRGSKKKRE